MELKITLAKDTHARNRADNIVKEYHSYVANTRTVGRCLKYLIYYDNELVGTFWLGSGFKPTPKAILNHFNVSQKEFDAMFNTVADNKRYCMIKHIPNLGTQILKLIRQRAYSDWKTAYGDELQAIITTIGSGKKGSVYLADNWQKIGETAGLPKDRKSLSMKWNSTTEIAERFTQPTGEDKKTILITTKLDKKYQTPYDNIFSDLFEEILEQLPEDMK